MLLQYGFEADTCALSLISSKYQKFEFIQTKPSYLHIAWATCKHRLGNEKSGTNK